MGNINVECMTQYMTFTMAMSPIDADVFCRLRAGRLAAAAASSSTVISWSVKRPATWKSHVETEGKPPGIIWENSGKKYLENP